MKQVKNSIPIHDLTPEDDLNTAGIRYAPIEIRKDHVHSAPHRHNYYAVLFFVSGNGIHLIDFKEYKIADNTVHLIKPGQVHMLQRTPDTYGAAIHFSKEEAMHFPLVANLMQMTSSPIHSHDSATFETISNMLTLLKAELAANSGNVVSTCLAMLLLKSIKPDNRDGRRYDADTKQLFISFETLAEQHYRQGYTPAWYAKQLNITEKKLNNICKDASGTTVSSFLKERVLLEAKRLLSHSGASVKEIGYYLGFDDPAYFARFFTTNAGINAKTFRQQHS